MMAGYVACMTYMGIVGNSGVKEIRTSCTVSPHIVRLTKLRRMRWAGHVARMGREEACTGLWWGNLRERDHWGDPGVDGKIILGWIFRKRDVGVWTGTSWLRIRTGGGRL